MPLPSRIEQSLSRLHLALDQIEAAVERAGEFSEQRANLQEELAIMQDDRTQLAVQLDGALARARTLELANAEVAQRLERIGGAIAHVLDQDAPDAESFAQVVDAQAADDGPDEAPGSESGPQVDQPIAPSVGKAEA